MSIASQIEDYADGLSDAYAMVAQRGGTIPAQKNMANLDTAIATIPSGGSSAGLQREISQSGVFSVPKSGSITLPSSAKVIADYAMYYGFYRTGATSADLSHIEEVSGTYGMYNAFYHSSLVTLDISGLKTISGSSGMAYAFTGSESLTTVDISGLETISGIYGAQRLFAQCSSLTTVRFTSLADLTGSSALKWSFHSCGSLTDLYFPALTANSFGSYTNQFNDMLSNTTGVRVHFPAAIQSTIGSWADVTNGFGGTNTTVLFDL